MNNEKEIYWPSTQEYLSSQSLEFKILYYAGAIKLSKRKYILWGKYNVDYRYRMWHPLVIAKFILLLCFKTIFGAVLGFFTVISQYVDLVAVRTIEIPRDSVKPHLKK